MLILMLVIYLCCLNGFNWQNLWKMKLVKLNGCIHLHNGEQFVKMTFAGLSQAVGSFAYSQGRSKTIAKILATVEFDENGLVVVG